MDNRENLARRGDDPRSYADENRERRRGSLIHEEAAYLCARPRRIKPNPDVAFVIPRDPSFRRSGILTRDKIIIFFLEHTLWSFFCSRCREQTIGLWGERDVEAGGSRGGGGRGGGEELRMCTEEAFVRSSRAAVVSPLVAARSIVDLSRPTTMRAPRALVITTLVR